MGIFLITPISNPDAVLKRVATDFPDEHFHIQRTGSILVYFPGTTKELSDKLGITTNEVGSAVVVSVGNYYGRAPTDVWEWIQSRLERS